MSYFFYFYFLYFVYFHLTAVKQNAFWRMRSSDMALVWLRVQT